MLIQQNLYYVTAGEFYYGTHNAFIKTTLGSCVAVTAWHPQKKISAMVHYLLPNKSHRQTDKGDDYYGDQVLPKLIRELSKDGLLTEFQYAAFGGGCFFNQDITDKDVGVRNVAYLKTWASLHKIHFRQQSLGGRFCRLVALNGTTGEIVVKEQS